MKPLTIPTSWAARLLVALLLLPLLAPIPILAWQFLQLVLPKKDEAAIRQLDAWGVRYQRHVIVYFPKGNVSVVTFDGAKVDREKMDLFVSLAEPTTVAFVRCDFAEEGMLSRVAECRTLETLFLWHDTVVDDDLIDLLPRLTSVRFLYLQDNPITDRCVEAIAVMPKLIAVMIQGTRITEQGKARLRALRPALDVDDTQEPRF